MKRIYLLRHGKTEPPAGDKEDHERTLLEAGRNDSLRIGLKMKNPGLLPENVLPEKVLSSTARRARETAGLCVESWDIHKDVELLENLYSGSVKDYIEVIRSLPEKLRSVLIVGHNPTIEEFNETLSGSYTAVRPAHLLWYEVDVPKWADIDLGLSPVNFGSLTP